MSESAGPPRLFLPTRYLIMPVLIGLLVFVAYGTSQPNNSAAEASSSAQAATEVDVDLTEWELLPSQFEFQQGDTITFNITNSGRFPHNLEVSNTAQHLHSPTIAATEATTLEVTFENSGTYTFICAIPGHAELGMSGELTVTGSSPAPEAGEYIGIPAMRTSPRNNTAVEGSSQEVRVILHDFVLDAGSIGDANVDGQGHWALFLDDELVDSLGEPTYTLEELNAGPHVVRVELRNNDGTPVDPPLETTATIQVPALGPLPPTPPGFVTTPSVGGLAPTNAALMGIGALGLLLLVSGTAITARRRV